MQSCNNAQTPWNEDDLQGRIRAGRLKGHPWTIVKFPAIAVEDEPAIRRKKGEPLWPERFDLAELEEKRQGLLEEGKGAYWWSALYQCEPQPDDGTIVLREYLRYYEVEQRPRLDPVTKRPLTEKRVVDGVTTDIDDPVYDDVNTLHLHKPRADERDPIETYAKEIIDDGGLRFATVDLAASLKTMADETAHASWLVLAMKYLILLDVYTKQLTGPQQIDLIARKAATYGLAYTAIERTVPALHDGRGRSLCTKIGALGRHACAVCGPHRRWRPVGAIGDPPDALEVPALAGY